MKLSDRMLVILTVLSALWLTFYVAYLIVHPPRCGPRLVIGDVMMLAGCPL